MSDMTRAENLAAIAKRIALVLPPEKRPAEIELYAREHKYEVAEIAAEIERFLPRPKAAEGASA